MSTFFNCKKDELKLIYCVKTAKLNHYIFTQMKYGQLKKLGTDMIRSTFYFFI